MILRFTLLGILAADAAAAAGLALAGIRDAFVFAAALAGCHILSSVGIMRILKALFPVPDGEFRNGSPEFGRWQAQAFLGALSCHAFDRFVPVLLKAQWYSLFGADLARGARVAGRLLDCSLVRMDEGSLLGVDAMVSAHFEVDGMIRVGSIRIGERATVGMRAVVLPGVSIGRRAVVAASALVPSWTRIPEGETWGGVPARKMKDTVLEECPASAGSLVTLSARPSGSEPAEALS